jgi:hypothetical protein
MDGEIELAWNDQQRNVRCKYFLFGSGVAAIRRLPVWIAMKANKEGVP